MTPMTSTDLRCDEALIEMIVNCGILVLEIKDDDRFAGLYCHLEDGGPNSDIIFYNSSLSIKERTWTLAHEFGHWHRDIFACSREDREYNELRADRFAYELLMPPEKLLEACLMGISNTGDLSDFLMIPGKRVEEGLKQMELIYGPDFTIDHYWLSFMPLHAMPLEELRKENPDDAWDFMY